MASAADAAAELLARRRARTSLLDFVRYLNPDYIVSDFSIQVCAALDQFIADMDAGNRPVLILSAPPQHGKSELVSRYLPAYYFGTHPDNRAAGLSYGKDLATDMNRDVQRIIMQDGYANIFPETKLNTGKAGTLVEAKRNSETFEIVNRKGSYIGQGVGGPLTGKRVDLGIVDDPVKNAQEALSQTVKDGVWNWYTSTFLTRLSKNSGQIIMATRWAKDDLSGRILASNPRAKALVFPAIDQDGKALVPELHPVEKLLELKATMSEYFWSAMYMQSPIILGGGIFKLAWWKYYQALPAIKYRVIYGDTAQKTSTANDYSVLQCWGMGADNRIYLLDQIRGKWEAPELLVMARTYWQKHKTAAGLGALRQMKIEDKSSGTGLIQQLKRAGIPVAGIPRGTDKVSRALDVSPQIEAGNVLLPDGAPWLADYLTEFAAFPNGAHDDQCDPTMDAISDMLISHARIEGGFRVGFVN